MRNGHSLIVLKVVWILMSVCLYFFDAKGQNARTRNWFFGENLGFEINNSLALSLLPNGQINTPAGCASMSDINGQLLFYTNGETIWNSSHAVMNGGANLNGSGYATQSCLIVPRPFYANDYFVFTIDDSCNNLLYYSKVDVSLNAGLGSVTQINIPLDSNMAEKIAGVAGANAESYWIIVHQVFNNSFYAYPVDSAGVGVPIISAVGSILNLNSCYGVLKASPAGNKLAMVMPGNNSFELFDFDNVTGMVYNAMPIGSSLPAPVYGCEFSPNGRFLYVNSTLQGITVPSIYQYDLSYSNAFSIDSAKVVIGFSQDPFAYTSMQLGRDGRIYCAGTNRQYLSFINLPDNLGSGCSFYENPIYLGGEVTQYGLPNFISSYFSNLTAVENFSLDDHWNVYPNPVTHFLVVENAFTEIFSMELRDASGRWIDAPVINKNRNAVRLNTSALSNGFYFLKVKTKNSLVCRKFVVLK